MFMSMPHWQQSVHTTRTPQLAKPPDIRSIRITEIIYGYTIIPKKK